MQEIKICISASERYPAFNVKRSKNARIWKFVVRKS